MVHVRNYLFNGDPLSDYLEARARRVPHAVEGIPEGQFTASSDEQVVEYTVAELTVTPLSIRPSEMTASEPMHGKMFLPNWPGDVDRPKVPSLSITFKLPYTGESALWSLRPNKMSGTKPESGKLIPGIQDSGEFLFAIELPADTDPLDFKQQVASRVTMIERYLGYQEDEIEEFNNGLPELARLSVAARRQKLSRAEELTRVLGIPLIQRRDTPPPPALPIKRRITLPSPTPKAQTSDYQISDNDYEHILKVIRHEGATFETTRETYLGLGEESLRNIILAHLNGHYEGDASGETFRGAGKTDIRIERQNRAAFVAECKEWKGGQQLLYATDQLLSYLTWRDSKTALVLFNKDVAGFRDLQVKMSGLLEGHSRFHSRVAASHEGEWRIRLKSQNDDENIVTVHVFLFDLYVPSSRR